MTNTDFYKESLNLIQNNHMKFVLFFVNMSFELKHKNRRLNIGEIHYRVKPTKTCVSKSKYYKFIYLNFIKSYQKNLYNKYLFHPRACNNK